MTILTKTLALFLLVCGISSATADTAEAGGKYAVATVANPLSKTVRYRYRWGNGLWKVTILDPGMTSRHSWRYQFEDQNSSPKLQVRFDADLGVGVYLRTYTLKKHSVPFRTIGGKKYRFGYQNVVKRIIKLTPAN